MSHRSHTPLALGLAALLVLPGCVSPPPATESFRPHNAATMEKQTARFDGIDEATLLAAIGAALNELGYHLEASEPSLGLVVAARDRDAVRALLIVVTSIAHRDRVSIAVRPAAGGTHDAWQVRTTWHRMLPMGPNKRLTFTLKDDRPAQELFDAIRRSIASQGGRP